MKTQLAKMGRPNISGISLKQLGRKEYDRLYDLRRTPRKRRKN
jgi:hypothetical protein